MKRVYGQTVKGYAIESATRAVEKEKSKKEHYERITNKDSNTRKRLQQLIIIKVNEGKSLNEIKRELLDIEEYKIYEKYLETWILNIEKKHEKGNDLKLKSIIEKQIESDEQGRQAVSDEEER